jgi:DNA-binding response OmpR family regulator
MVEVPGPQETHSRARLLVVDDEANLRAGLRDLLSLMGYQVEEAASGYEALGLLESQHYDLMVLDIRMPGIDGIESAIAAVKTDAVDYMLKPFNIDDLATTISQALEERAETLRHQQLLSLIGSALDTLDQSKGPAASSSLPPTPPTHRERFLHAGPMTLDRHKRLVVMQGDPPRTIELTDGETAILAVLMEHPNEVLSCSEMVHVAMGYDLDEQDAQNQVRLYVFRLRRKIEVDASNPLLIRTVRGRGYFLALS